ncbi:hypothetical protein SAMN04488543_3539 [Friedmanniella luteola]|uniref:DUF1579 domain-containing protein n=1 Tax=Friedmanniella luteola TaxID=546871 RepID=A0A1H1Z200_9ACTN|nr:hypothetical protein [Friedmanniella luteola]SDT27764.1 hypothetical protein SAMN04488543_3539 [Friedmanniella luteola]
MDLAADFLPLLGTWTGLERLGADADAPTARASLVLRLDVDGTAVVQDYRQVRADGAELTVHGVFRVTAPGQVGWWRFDSAGGPPALATGGVRAGVLELTDADQRHRFRREGDELGQQVERRDGDGWRPVLNGRYRRLTGH